MRRGALPALLLAVAAARAGAASRSVGGYAVAVSQAEPGALEAALTLPGGRTLDLGPALRSALPSDPPSGQDSTRLVIALGAQAHEIRGFGVAGSVEAPPPVRLPADPLPGSSSAAGRPAPAERGLFAERLLLGALRDAPSSRPAPATPAPGTTPPPPAAPVQFFKLPPASSYRTVPLAAAAADAIVACRLEILRLPAGASAATPPSVLCFGDGEPVFYPDVPRPGQPTRFVVWSAASAAFVRGLP